MTPIIVICLQNSILKPSKIFHDRKFRSIVSDFIRPKIPVKMTYFLVVLNTRSRMTLHYLNDLFIPNGPCQTIGNDPNFNSLVVKNY